MVEQNKNTPASWQFDEARIAQLSKLALSMMHSHHVQPTPENYAIWYYYAISEHKGLVKEVDTIINDRIGFSDDTSRYLYQKYIASDPSHRSADQSATDANKLLGEVLRIVNEFRSETTSYNQNVDGYLSKVSADVPDAGVKNVLREIITATASLRESGASLNKKLEESQQEINSLRKNLEKVTTEAQRDFLTGVYNRKALDHMMDEQMELAKLEKQELSLLMIDVDHFKKFNDRFGHLLGDEVLKIVARVLVEMVKGKDIVSRFGGEEFAVLLPNTPLKGGLIVGEAIRAAIASRQLKRKDTGAVFAEITVSIGVAVFRPETDTIPSFVKRADDALYGSKKNGRNRVTQEA